MTENQKKNPEYCKAKFNCIHPVILGELYCPHCIWNKNFLDNIMGAKNE